MLAGRVIAKIIVWSNPLPKYEQHDEINVKCIKELPFINAAQTVNNTPRITFFPK